MTCNYRLIQITNTSIGAVAANTAIPVGVINNRTGKSSPCAQIFKVTTTANNVININEPGLYKITYNGYLTAGAAAGNVVINLQVNGTTVATATVTATAGGTVSVPLTFVIRVKGNCCNAINLPAILQFINAGVALTGGSGNIILERVAN